MRVFVAGATGAIGRRLVPLLVRRGHEVTAMARTATKAAVLRAAGAEVAVVADGLDAGAVMRAVGAARFEVVVHEMTALSNMSGNLRRFDRDFALTNRLRTEGTDALLAAARRAGTRRVIAQSFAGWPYAREGGWVKGEDDRLDPGPPKAMRRTLSALRHVERAVAGAGDLEGLVLRYGTLYGPGTSLAPDGAHAETTRRCFPIVGQGTAVWSFVHVDDAAAATAAAIEGGSPGLYNVVDDDPAPVWAWLPHLADALGAMPPRHAPLWLGRLATGEVGASLMTQVRGASNEKAKRELGWHPGHPSWRTGFHDVAAQGRAAQPVRIDQVGVMVPAAVHVITLGARDLDTLRAFYRGLGWPLAVDLDDFAAFRTAGAVLALFPLERLAADGRAQSAAPERGMRGAVMTAHAQPRGEPMSYRLLAGTEMHWRPSNQMGVLNTDLARQLELATLGARLWRLRPGEASTRHRHREQVELYLLLEGRGAVRVDGDRLELRPGDALAVEPASVRQVFNDTTDEQLWLAVGAPPEPANTLEMSDQELRWLYPDGPRALPPELEAQP